MTAREEILGRLKSAGKQGTPKPPAAPPLSELGLGREGMIARFTSELAVQSGAVHRAHDAADALRILTDIAALEGITSVIASEDETILSLSLKAWGTVNGVDVRSRADFASKEDFREWAFTAHAGITSADFAIAETGTMATAFDEQKPRLVSIAPPIHIAVIPAGRLVPVYENAVEAVFKGGDYPSQLCLVSGPSATGDIQAVQFKGMHGPTKVIVIFITSGGG